MAFSKLPARLHGLTFVAPWVNDERRFKMPLRSRSESAPPPRRPAPELRAAPAPRQRGEPGPLTALVVDDEVAVREVFADILRIGAYRVVKARNGQRGFGRFDLGQSTQNGRSVELLSARPLRFEQAPNAARAAVEGGRHGKR